MMTLTNGSAVTPSGLGSPDDACEAGPLPADGVAPGEARFGLAVSAQIAFCVSISG